MTRKYLWAQVGFNHVNLDSVFLIKHDIKHHKTRVNEKLSENDWEDRDYQEVQSWNIQQLHSKMYIIQK